MGEAVHVDGLVITASGLVVNEEATVSGLANVSKDEVWLADPYALLKTNCFVLSGSVIRKGRAEILVCLTGRNTSYARR